MTQRHLLQLMNHHLLLRIVDHQVQRMGYRQVMQRCLVTSFWWYVTGLMSQPQKFILLRRASKATVPQPQKTSATRLTRTPSDFANASALVGINAGNFAG